MEAAESGRGCQLIFIAALDVNGVMGTGHGLPWLLPSDIAHFRIRNRGHWLLLGRHTFEEMRGWFTPAETPLVLTSHPDDFPRDQGAIPVRSASEALALAEAAGQKKLMHCGGAAAFAAALPLADELILTRVAYQVPPEPHLVYFPPWDCQDWVLIDEWSHLADAEHAYAFRVQTWVRHAANAEAQADVISGE